MMDFDGKQKVKDKVQQGQTLMNQLAMMQEQVTKLGMIVQQLTGEDLIGLGDQGAAAQPTAPSGGGESAQKKAETGTMTSYGEKLASRATPDMNRQ